ncbi:MAG: hypothetical protein OXF93_14810 [Acidobacteria bacterium]|nr:hypothetical protein [Acidobacteriota bacterium]
MEVEQGERQGSAGIVDDRCQGRGTQALGAADELELRHLVLQVQRVQAPGADHGAAEDRDHAHVSRPAEALEPTPLADPGHQTARGRDRIAASPVGRRAPQVVDVPVRDAGEAFEAPVAEQAAGTSAERPRQRTGQLPVERVELGEELDVGGGVAAREWASGSPAVVPQTPGGPVLAQQPRDLRAGEPGDFTQKVPENPLPGLALAGIVESFQRPLDEPVGLGARPDPGVRVARPASLERRPHLSQRLSQGSASSHGGPPMARGAAGRGGSRVGWRPARSRCSFAAWTSGAPGDSRPMSRLRASDSNVAQPAPMQQDR